MSGENCDITDEEFIERLRTSADYVTSVLCSHYLGWAHIRLQLLEEYTATLVLMCDETRVKIKLGKRELEWYAAVEKMESINRSTFGTVVGLLLKAGTRQMHDRYLRGVVALRNQFVHHFPKVAPFPGEFERYEFPRSEYLRRAFYFGRRFAGAERYLPKILADAGLLVRTSIGDAGWLLSHPHLERHLGSTHEDPPQTRMD